MVKYKIYLTVFEIGLILYCINNVNIYPNMPSEVPALILNNSHLFNTLQYNFSQEFTVSSVTCNLEEHEIS